jgi:hypothetical protein
MEAVTRHDVGAMTENLGCGFLHIHQIEEAQLAPLIIEEQIDVGIFVGFVTRHRAEHVEMFDAKPLEVLGTFAETAYGFVTLHKTNITRSAGYRSIPGQTHATAQSGRFG